MERPSVKKTDIGLAGALIILAQTLSSHRSTDQLSKEIQNLKDDIRALKVDQQEFFVRKPELELLEEKLNLANEQLSNIKNWIQKRKERS